MKMIKDQIGVSSDDQFCPSHMNLCTCQSARVILPKVCLDTKGKWGCRDVETLYTDVCQRRYIQRTELY